MFRTHALFFFFAALVGLSTPALAQDDPESALDQEAALLEGGGGLEERKPAEKPVLDDPDARLLKEVQEARAQIEAKMNALQVVMQKMQGVEIEMSAREAKKFTGLDARLQKLTGKMLKITDPFDEGHIQLLDAYRTAVKEGRIDAKEKAGKAVIQARKKVIKALSSLVKAADKMVSDAEKLAAKAAPPEEEPAEPAEPAGK